MKGTTTFKSLKTKDLRQGREEEIQQEVEDNENQLSRSIELLQQFRETKMVLINFTYHDKQKKIISSSNTYNILDELRRERKIIMALQNANLVDEYIGIDLTDIDLHADNSHLPEKVRETIARKDAFRRNLAQVISNIRLDYMLKVLKKQYKSKASISDPDAFVDKLKQLERMIMKNGIQRQKSTNSLMSLFSKSQNSMVTSINDKTLDDLDTGDIDDTTYVKGLSSNPLLDHISDFFEEFQ